MRMQVAKYSFPANLGAQQLGHGTTILRHNRSRAQLIRAQFVLRLLKARLRSAASSPQLRSSRAHRQEAQSHSRRSCPRRNTRRAFSHAEVAIQYEQLQEFQHDSSWRPILRMNDRLRS